WKLENVGHAVRHVFSVKWVDRDHPISRGLDPSFLANDELYHKMDFKPNVHVLATAYDDPKRGGTGKEEPIVWTVPFGSGRVVHTSLGHDLSAMVQPGFLAVLARGTEWAATGRVTLPARIPPRAEAAGDAVRVLVVTGGHPYPTSFYSLFEGYSDIRWSHATTLAEAYTPDMKDRWDTVVLHDLHNEIGEKEKQNLRAFVESGKGVVSLHHAIADYPAWPWWYEDVIGGEYFVKAMAGHGAATFHEGVEMIARPVDRMAAHPVLRGVGPIVVRDEAYRGMWHSPKITVLMTTDHPENDAPVVYLGPHARTVYIQLGHDTETFRHPGYRRLLHNAILWSAGRLN
ncbi:MAG: ThuA domain-containing protein, partial [Acidobacteria bacterium]|nr:ThuA domain-containing protein [Acidobacteriota bacterium]